MTSEIHHRQTGIFYILAVFLAIRLCLASSLGLGIDESYAVAISRESSWSYYDHPPLGFWLGRWSAMFFGTESALIVRLPYVILFTGSTWLIYRFTIELFNEEAAFWAAAWFSTSPFFLVSAGTWVVPDGPLIFFLLATATLVVPLLGNDVSRRLNNSEQWARWLLAGVAFGLALLSKYQAGLFAVGAFISLLTTRSGRAWLCHPAPYLSCLIACLIFSPVLIWNYQNDWVSFAFQGNRAFPNNAWTLADGMFNFARLICGQMLYLLPGILIVAIFCLIRAYKMGRSQLGSWICLWLALPSILLFNSVALVTFKSLPHWPMAGFVFVFPLIGDWCARNWDSLGTLIRRTYYTTVGLMVIVMFVIVLHVNTGFIGTFFHKTPPKWTDTTQVDGWFELATVFSRHGWLKRDDVVVVAKNWIEGAKIDYVLGGLVPVKVLSDDRRHFGFMHNNLSLKGKMLIIVSRYDRHADTNKRSQMTLNAVSQKLSCQLLDQAGAIWVSARPSYHSFLIISAYTSGVCR